MLSNEKLITLSQAAKMLPHRPAASTIWRWMTRGSRGVRLETMSIGGMNFTSVEALERFIAGTTAARDRKLNTNAQAPRTPASRRRSHDRAMAALEAAGI